MNILHLSDIHYLGTYPQAESGYRSIFGKLTSPARILAACVSQARSQCGIDLAVVTGDLTENGDASDYDELRQVLDAALDGIPYVLTLGNHDVKSAFWKGWFGFEGCSDAYNTVYDAGELAIVSLDSSDGTPNGRIDAARAAWLGTTLDALGRKPAILITHHHFLVEQGVVPPVPRDESFDEALTHGNLIGILNGHTHHSFTSEYRGIPYYTANSLSFAGFDQAHGVRFEEMYGFNLYEVVGGDFVYQRTETFSPRRVLGTVIF